MSALHSMRRLIGPLLAAICLLPQLAHAVPGDPCEYGLWDCNLEDGGTLECEEDDSQYSNSDFEIFEFEGVWMARFNNTDKLANLFITPDSYSKSDSELSGTFSWTNSEKRNSQTLYTFPGRIPYTTPSLVKWTHLVPIAIALDSREFFTNPDNPKERMVQYSGALAGDAQSEVTLTGTVGKLDFVATISYGKSPYRSSRYPHPDPSLGSGGSCGYRDYDLAAPKSDPDEPHFGNNKPAAPIFTIYDFDIKSRLAGVTLDHQEERLGTAGSGGSGSSGSSKPKPKPTPKPKPKPSAKKPKVIPPYEKYIFIGKEKISHYPDLKTAIKTIKSYYGGILEDTVLNVDESADVTDVNLTGLNLKGHTLSITSTASSSRAKPRIGAVKIGNLKEGDGKRGTIAIRWLKIQPKAKSPAKSCIAINGSPKLKQPLQIKLEYNDLSDCEDYGVKLQGEQPKEFQLRLVGNTFNPMPTAVYADGDFRGSGASLLELRKNLIAADGKSGKGPAVIIDGPGSKVIVAENSIQHSGPFLRRQGGGEFSQNTFYGPLMADNNGAVLDLTQNTFLYRGLGSLFLNPSGKKAVTDQRYFLLYNLFVGSGIELSAPLSSIAVASGNIFATDQFDPDFKAGTAQGVLRAEQPSGKKIFTPAELSRIAWLLPSPKEQSSQYSLIFEHNVNSNVRDIFRFIDESGSYRKDSVVRLLKYQHQPEFGELAKLLGWFRSAASLSRTYQLQSGEKYATSGTPSVSTSEDALLYGAQIGAKPLTISVDDINRLDADSRYAVLTIGDEGEKSSQVSATTGNLRSLLASAGLKAPDTLTASIGLGSYSDSISKTAAGMCAVLEQWEKLAETPDILTIVSHGYGAYVLSEAFSSGSDACRQILATKKVFLFTQNRPSFDVPIADTIGKCILGVGGLLSADCERSNYAYGGDGKMATLRGLHGVYVDERSLSASAGSSFSALSDYKQILLTWKASQNHPAAGKISSVALVYISGFYDPPGQDLGTVIQGLLGEMPMKTTFIDYQESKSREENARAICDAIEQTPETDATILMGYSAGAAAMATTTELCPCSIKARRNSRMLLLEPFPLSTTMVVTGQVLANATLLNTFWHAPSKVLSSCNWVRCWMDEHVVNSPAEAACQCEDQVTSDVESFVKALIQVVAEASGRSVFGYEGKDVKQCVSPSGLETLPIRVWVSPGSHAPGKAGLIDLIRGL